MEARKELELIEEFIRNSIPYDITSKKREFKTDSFNVGMYTEREDFYMYVDNTKRGCTTFKKTVAYFKNGLHKYIEINRGMEAIADFINSINPKYAELIRDKKIFFAENMKEIRILNPEEISTDYPPLMDRNFYTVSINKHSKTVQMGFQPIAYKEELDYMEVAQKIFCGQSDWIKEKFSVLVKPESSKNIYRFIRTGEKICL